MTLREIATWLEEDGRWPISHVHVGRVLHDGRMAVMLHRMAIKQYDVVVLDPPWPMPRIQLQSRPNTPAGLEYKTMTLDEIGEIELPTKSGHVYLWTTMKYVRDSYDLFRAWGVTPVWLHVWKKQGGPKPPNLPNNNAEFCLYGRIGSPNLKPKDEREWWTIFEARQEGKHSNKPHAFFEDVARRWDGRRISMFERTERPGFDSWGDEAPEKAAAEAKAEEGGTS